MPYTLEKLKNENELVRHKYGITQSDVDMVNQFTAQIRASRNPTFPQAGDVVKYTDKHANFYNSAYVVATHGRGAFSGMNLGGTVPTVYTNEDGSLHLSPGGGGPWLHENIPFEEFVLQGRRKLKFRYDKGDTFRRDNYLYFTAKVNVWRYTEPGNPHPEFTTEHWRKMHISYHDDGHGKPTNGSTYLYFGENTAFENEKEFRAWQKTYQAVLFGHGNNAWQAFYYREEEKLIRREEWNRLDLPIDTRLCNGIILVKVDYDLANHLVKTYRYTNDGSWINYKRNGGAEGRWWLQRQIGRYERAKGTPQNVLAALVEPADVLGAIENHEKHFGTWKGI